MRARAAFIAAASVIVLGGCATRLVSSHVEPSVDFENYHSYAWGPVDALPVGDPRLDNNEFFRDYFQGAIEKEMATRHVALTSTDPDLLIHVHSSVGREVDVDAIEREYPNCQGPNCRPTIIEYEVGTLMIDMVDARSNKLIWRAWSRENFSGVIDDQQRLRQVVVHSVAEMMKRFPKPL